MKKTFTKDFILALCMVTLLLLVPSKVKATEKFMYNNIYQSVSVATARSGDASTQPSGGGLLDGIQAAQATQENTKSAGNELKQAKNRFIIAIAVVIFIGIGFVVVLKYMNDKK